MGGQSGGCCLERLPHQQHPAAAVRLRRGEQPRALTYTSGKQLTVGGKCLDASGAGTTAGTKAILWVLERPAGQQWNVNGNGTITGVQSGLYLDASGLGTANGTLIHLWSARAARTSRWRLRDPVIGRASRRRPG